MSSSFLIGRPFYIWKRAPLIGAPASRNAQPTMIGAPQLHETSTDMLRNNRPETSRPQPAQGITLDSGFK